MVRPIRALFTDDVLDTAAQLYAGDFKELGYDDVMPGGLDPSNAYSDDAVAEAERVLEREARSTAAP